MSPWGHEGDRAPPDDDLGDTLDQRRPRRAEVVGGGPRPRDREGRRTWSASRRPDRTLPNGIPGLPALCLWRHRISGLTPGDAYDVTVVPTIRSERLVGRFETLPDELPLRILAASCYDARSDTTILSALPLYLPAAVRTGWLAELVRRVRRGVRTLLSALPDEDPRCCCRAVSRSATARSTTVPPPGRTSRSSWATRSTSTRPVREFYRRATPAALVRRVARSYQQSWEMLGEFLSLGANVMVSDDHEFWNDYPGDTRMRR